MSSYIVYTFPKFVVADDEASLDTGDAYECAMTSAVLNPTINYATIPARGCSGPSESPSQAAWSLALAWLQDFTDPGGGLSGYAFTNMNTRKWFRLMPDKDDPTVAATGEVWIAPGAFGGTFGDGSAAPATAEWKVIGAPTFDFPAALPLTASA